MKPRTRELTELCDCIPTAVILGQWTVYMNKSVPGDSPVCKSLHTYQNKKGFEQKLYTQIKDTLSCTILFVSLKVFEIIKQEETYLRCYCTRVFSNLFLTNLVQNILLQKGS